MQCSGRVRWSAPGGNYRRDSTRRVIVTELCGTKPDGPGDIVVKCRRFTKHQETRTRYLQAVIVLNAEGVILAVDFTDGKLMPSTQYLLKNLTPFIFSVNHSKRIATFLQDHSPVEWGFSRWNLVE